MAKLGAMKCHVCGKVKEGFVAFNCLFYCGNPTDPEGCFQMDVHGKLREKRERESNKDARKESKAKRKYNHQQRKPRKDDWIPSVLREKSVHTSTVGVGK